MENNILNKMVQLYKSIAKFLSQIAFLYCDSKVLCHQVFTGGNGQNTKLEKECSCKEQHTGGPCSGLALHPGTSWWPCV